MIDPGAPPRTRPELYVGGPLGSGPHKEVEVNGGFWFLKP